MCNNNVFQDLTTIFKIILDLYLISHTHKKITI
jgi:hypothetical protein